MVEISKGYLKKVAQNARICQSHSTEQELDNLVDSVQSLLKLVSSLQKIDVTGLSPLYLPTEHLLKEKTLRSDEVQMSQCVQYDQIQENAPSFQEGFFKVPKVVG